MNPYAIAALFGFAIGLAAAGCVCWAVGDGSRRIDAALAELDHDEQDSAPDDLMDVANDIQDDSDIDSPVPFIPADWPTTEPDQQWLRTIGVRP